MLLHVHILRTSSTDAAALFPYPIPHVKTKAALVQHTPGHLRPPSNLTRKCLSRSALKVPPFLQLMCKRQATLVSH